MPYGNGVYGYELYASLHKREVRFRSTDALSCLSLEGTKRS